MPTVPTYDGPQVRERPLEGGFQRAPDVSTNLNEAAKALDVVGEVANRIALRRDHADAWGVESKIKSDWLQHDAELRKSYRGANVDGYKEEVEKWWGEAPAKYGSELGTRARMLVDRPLAAAKFSASGGALRYYEAEKEKHAVESFAAAKITTIQMAMVDGRPEAILSARADLLEKNAMEGGRRGMTTDEVGVMNLRDTTALHLDYIARLAEKNPGEARSWFNAHKDEIQGDRHKVVIDVLDREEDNQFATQTAAEWATLPYAEQLKKAGEIDDPQRREKTLLAIKNNQAQVRAADEARQRQFSDQAWQLVGQGQRVPEAVLMAMDGRERVQLQDYLRQRAEHALKGTSTDPKTDTDTHARLWTMPDEDFKKEKLEAHRYNLSQTDLEQLARRQHALLNAKVGEPSAVATTDQLIGTYTAGWKKEKTAAYKAFVYGELDRAQQVKKGDLTYEEKNEIMTRAATPGEVMYGVWWRPDPDRMLFETTEEERRRFVPDISKSDRKLIIEALQGEGFMRPSEEQIADRYKMVKGFK